MGEATTDIKPYKPAKVYTGPNESFVKFHYWSKKEHRYIPDKARLSNLGFRPTKEERAQLLKYLCNELNIIINLRNQAGIFHEDIKPTGGSLTVSFYEYISLIKQDATIELPYSTRSSIGNMCYSYGQFIAEQPVFATLLPHEVTEVAIKQFIKFLQNKGLVGKTINMYLWALQVVTEQLVQKKVLEKAINTEPLRVKQRKNETEQYRPLTEEEKVKVFDYFRERDPFFYLYVLCIYYTCIRPGELKRLFISNFILESKKIYVSWYVAKNGLTKYVQILKPLYNAFNDLKIKSYPPKYYLFGTRHEPSIEKYKGKYSSDKWREACRKLDIDDTAQMYGLKHTFIVDYIEKNRKNIDWEWLRQHCRHADVRQTMDYVRELTPYFLDETQAIIENYHDQTVSITA